MSLGPQNSYAFVSEGSLGSLRGCLVEGDAEQRHRERRIRRRALAVSIALQSAVLAALVLVPLFGRSERMVLAYPTPIPPYSRYHGTSHTPAAPKHPSGSQNACRFCAPLHIPATIPTHDTNSPGNQVEEPQLDEGIGLPGGRDGLIPLSDTRSRLPEQYHIQKPAEPPRIVHVTQLDPAMLIRRVEPVYPPLAKQTRREGRVELRAIIGTDGTIQSLQIVAGDQLFLASAVEAVQQWRYKPTILNGRSVQIDTYITVVYTLQH